MAWRHLEWDWFLSMIAEHGTPPDFYQFDVLDLRQVREDLDRTIRDLGHEAVRHETGAIAYSQDQKLEAAAYREVELCDILVAIVGGRYGSESRDNPGSSITQTEIRKALERGIQVFTFVEHSVYSEHETYELNQDSEAVRYKYVDNRKVFQFITELRALPQNNVIRAFETAADVISF